MKNLHRRRPDDLANQLQTEELACTICESWKFIIIGSMQHYCERGKQWPKYGICRFREVKKADNPVDYGGL